MQPPVLLNIALVIIAIMVVRFQERLGFLACALATRSQNELGEFEGLRLQMGISRAFMKISFNIRLHWPTNFLVRKRQRQ